MSKSHFKHVKIAGMSVVVPEKEINIYDEAEYYGGNIKKIDRMRKMVGFHKRRVADARTTASDLAVEASRVLIEDMKLNRDEIDALVFVVQMPDFTSPANAFYIHKELGLSDDTPCFDINMGCAGFVYGMWSVSQMIESGTCKRVLLVFGDTPAKGMEFSNRNVAPIFGDAGAAVLVDYSKEVVESYYNIETRSKGFESILTPMSGARMLPSFFDDAEWELFCSMRDKKVDSATGNTIGLFNLQLDGLAVFNFTIDVVPPNIRALMDYANVEEEDITSLLLHQANKQIVQAVGSAAQFPEEKAPYYAFENYGNNTMCSIPTNIASVLKEQSESENIKVVASGYGNGLTCASCVLELDNIYNSGIRDYVVPDETPTKTELYDYYLEKAKEV